MRKTIAAAAAALIVLGGSTAAVASSSTPATGCPQSLVAGVRPVTVHVTQRTTSWLRHHPGHNLAEIIRDTLECQGGGWQEQSQYAWAQNLDRNPVMHAGMRLFIDRQPYLG